MKNEEEQQNDDEQNNEGIAGVPTEENPGHSTEETPGITGNRTTQERRVGSGNTRTGSIEAQKAADGIE